MKLTSVKSCYEESPPCQRVGFWQEKSQRTIFTMKWVIIKQKKKQEEEEKGGGGGGGREKRRKERKKTQRSYIFFIWDLMSLIKAEIWLGTHPVFLWSDIINYTSFDPGSGFAYNIALHWEPDDMFASNKLCLLISIQTVSTAVCRYTHVHPAV